MNKLILILLLFTWFNSYEQTYNPSVDGIVTNVPLAIAQAVPTDSRSMYHDRTFNTWRQFTSTTEVLTWLNLAKYRTGGFDIYVNVGGVLSSGIITGGINYVYWFRNGTSNSDLVLKGNITSVNGQSGIVQIGNADSLKTYPIDTAANTDGYVLTFDKVNKKIILTAKGGGPTYTNGTGIDITGNVISALNTSAIWNANSIRGRPVSLVAPTVGQGLNWDGLAWSPKSLQVFNQILYDNDTLYFISGTDTLKTEFIVSVPGDNWGFQTAVTVFPITGNGTGGNGISVDTVSANGVATKYDLTQINPGSGGPTVRLINPLLGDTLSVKLNDSTYKIKALVAGANVTFSRSDTTVTINSTPGAAEINDNDSTLTATGNMTVGVESMIDYFLIKPTANLAAFKVGTISDDDAFITSTPVQANGEFQILIAPVYLSTSTDIYFSGITSSTDIQIIFKPLHR